jgi:phytol kinase
MIENFIKNAIPSYPQILYFMFVSAVAIVASGLLAGALKKYAGWKTGYTRKTLHFLIFFTAVGLHMWGGMPAVNVLGVGMGLFVLYSVVAGDGNFFFESMAREKDFPRRGYFIVVPYLTTAAGGLISNLLFGGSVIMGYALCGAADAIAEPVGVRFGKHKYKVPSLRKVKVAERSLEGSFSVFFVSWALSLLLFVYFYRLPLENSLIASFVLSLVLTLVEAVSFHGSDNLTIQVAASGLAYFFLHVWA